MRSSQIMLLRSLIKWAMKECNKWINGHPYLPKQTAVEMFIDKMNEFAVENKNTSVIFSVAADVGVSVLDDLILRGDAR